MLGLLWLHWLRGLLLLCWLRGLLLLCWLLRLLRGLLHWLGSIPLNIATKKAYELLFGVQLAIGGLAALVLWRSVPLVESSKEF